MSEKKFYLGIDFGASNGRAILADFDGSIIRLEEKHRFENRPVFMGNTLYWDLLRLFSDLKIGLAKAAKDVKNISSMGVETWGCDYGLLDKDKQLLSNPVHYRDERTKGIMEEAIKKISKEEIFTRTGVQFLELNTIYQLYSMRLAGSGILDNSEYLLLMGDLINYFLTGEMFNEFTNGTVTQLLNPTSRKWDEDILNRLDIPVRIFQEISLPGKIIGTLKGSICRETGCPPIPVALPAYDTSSELAAVPLAKENSAKNYAFLNCGTWAMVGTVNDKLFISKETLEKGFGNEGGADGRYNLLTNIVGLWIIQQCRRKWLETNKEVEDWNRIVEMAKESDDNNIFIDIDDQDFEKEIFDMPGAMVKYCKKTGQKTPRTIGEITRCFYESLVLKYLINLNDLENITGKKFELLHMVGGGSRNRFLCQMISDATGLQLIAGPAEATVIGNIITQMLATGDISSLQEGKEIICSSFKPSYFEPGNDHGWPQKLGIYRDILEKNR